MVNTVRSPLLRYGVAVFAVAIALGLKLLMEPLITVDSPFLLFFAAVMIAALVGGIQAGILATVLAAVSTNYLFFPPKVAFGFEFGHTLQLGLFMLEGILVAWVIAALTKARQRIQQGQEALHNAYANLEQRVQDRTVQLSEANQKLQQQIGERQQMEQAMRESDRRFRAIFNQTFQFIGLMQPDGTLIEANQTALDFAALQSRDVINRPFWEAYWWTISKQTQERLKAAIAEAATGTFVRYEVDVLGREGAIVTIDFSIKPVQDETGRVVLLIPEGRDITALKQSQQVLQSFFDSASMMMGIVELVGDDIRHIFDNAAAARFFGTEPEQLTQQLASGLGTSTANIQIWLEHYRQAEQFRTPVRFEYLHRLANGQEFWLSATVCQIPDRSVDYPRFAYIVEDISDRKAAQLELERTQVALQASIDLLRGIIDGSNDVITALDPEFRYIAFNRSFQQVFQQLFGRPAELGMTLMDSLAHRPGDQAKALALWSRALQGEEFTEIEEFGDEQTGQTYELAFSSIRNAEGDLIGAAQVVRNVTDRIRIEEEIRQLNAALEARVQQRTAQLETMNQLLEQEVRDRRTAEWELARSEQKFRLVAESMPQIVWTATPEGTVDYYNQRWAEYSGIPTEQAQGWGWQPVLHPADEQLTMDAWTSAVRTGELYQCEHRIRSADGEFRWFLSRGLPLKDRQGQIVKWFGTATDIHAQKQVQEDLRESQERFRQLAETVKDVFWLLDTSTGKILYVSPAYEEIWGRSRENLYRQSDDWLQGIHPEDRKRLQIVLSQANSREGYDQIFRVIHSDGTVRWIRDRGFPVYNDAKQICRIAGLAEDITERKLAEEALRQSEERFRVALDNIPDVFVIYDRDRRIQFVNAEGLRRTQLSLSDFMGRRDEEIQPPEVYQAYLPTLIRTVETLAIQTAECTITLPTYGTYTIVVTYVPLLNDQGELQQILGFTHDITERKQSEESLRLSEERFRVALQHSPIAVFNQDRELRYTWIHNPKLGYALEEIVGKSDFDLMDEATANILSQVKQQVLTSGIGTRQEVQATSEIGQTGYYDLTVEPMRDEAGQVVGITAAAVDVTERKKIEAQLQQANRLKDEFLATVSHELRTPLNSMLGWAKLLPARQFDPTTTTRAIESISRNTQTLAQLVEDVLDMSDILTGQLKLQMTPVDLALITEQAISAIDLAAQAKRIQIHTHSTLTTEIVLGDATRLQQVVWNLLSNSVKFTPEGGRVNVNLSVTSGQWTVKRGQAQEVDLRKSGQELQPIQQPNGSGQKTDTTANSSALIHNSYICLTITDTGQGISPEFLPFVFDRFRQEDGSTTRTHGGLGLGLAIVRYLVELHGGTIAASSPGLNQGATFTVLLPTG